MTLRRLFNALLAGFLCLSCTNDESTAQADNIELVKEVYLLINRHEWKELEKLFADSVGLKAVSYTHLDVYKRQGRHQYLIPRQRVQALCWWFG